MNYADNGIILAIAGLIISLIGNLAQYFLPSKKNKREEDDFIAEAAKKITESASIMTESLNKQLEALYQEANEYKEKNKLQEAKIAELEAQIASLQEEISRLKDIIEAQEAQIIKLSNNLSKNSY
jgi:peptidoglycan hydrolase CwlO-like protein